MRLTSYAHFIHSISKQSVMKTSLSLKSMFYSQYKRLFFAHNFSLKKNTRTNTNRNTAAKKLSQSEKRYQHKCLKGSFYLQTSCEIWLLEKVQQCMSSWGSDALVDNIGCTKSSQPTFVIVKVYKVEKRS